MSKEENRVFDRTEKVISFVILNSLFDILNSFFIKTKYGSVTSL